MNILYQANRNFLLPMSVSLFSLLDNNLECEEINIYIINDGFDADAEEKIKEKVSSYGRTVEFLYLDEVNEMLSSCGVKKWNGSYTTYFKLFIANQLKGLDRIFYIDSDTVVNGPIDKAYYIDMEDKIAAMVYDISIGTKVAGKTEFFNAGIFLLNLEEYRRQNIEDRVMEILQNKEFVDSIKTADQDIFNAYFYDKIVRMPCEYNYTTAYFLFGNEKWLNKLGINRELFYSSSELKKAKENPKIIHYLDHYLGRPWDRFNNSPCRALYSKKARELKDLNFEIPFKKRTVFEIIIKMVVLIVEKILSTEYIRKLVYLLFVAYDKSIEKKQKNVR